MDAYSITYTSASRRNSSRIYQDLKTTRLHSIVELDPQQGKTVLHSVDEAARAKVRGSGRKPHIGVIGAGLAGLRCADVLLQYGFQVTILEGRNRLGGRMHQERLQNGHLVDMGPNWIHGTDDNPILELAKLTDTQVGSWDTRSYIFDGDGQLLSLEDGDNYSAVMWDIVQDAFKHSNKNSSDIEPNESLYDFFTARVVEIFPFTTKDYERKRQIVLRMATLWGAFVGSPIERQSLKFFWLEECLEGENLFCAGTYEKILHTIAKPAVDGAVIQYKTVVSNIHGKSVSGEEAKVTTTDGQTFIFDEVVLTAPLGWLKQNLDAFDPPLPPRLLSAVQAIGYGCLEKVYISFPKPFWLTPDSNGRVVQGFAQWLSPSYAPESNPERWTNEVVELGSLPSSTAHPTLLFYIYGAEAKHVTSMLRELGDKDKQDRFLSEFFKPYYSRLPHFEEGNPHCRPTECLATNWLHDELSGNGSYSNFQVGLEVGDDDIRAMREGLPSEGLWLAGEHTAPFVALGTATGAYWSGESVGRRIAEAYGKGKDGA